MNFLDTFPFVKSTGFILNTSKKNYLVTRIFEFSDESLHAFPLPRGDEFKERKFSLHVLQLTFRGLKECSKVVTEEVVGGGGGGSGWWRRWCWWWSGL